MKRKNAGITWRVLKQYHGYNKRYFPLKFLRLFFEAVTPYFNLWMSAQIITALYEGRDQKQIVSLILAALFGNLLIRILGAFLLRESDHARMVLDEKEAAAFQKKTISLDYDKLEDPAVRALRRKIKENAWINGYGTSLMRRNVEKLFSSAFWLLFALFLFGDMVASMSGQDLSALPLFVLLFLCVSMAVVIRYNQFATKKMALADAEASDLMLKENQIEAGFHLNGMDSRIYKQQQIVTRVEKEQNEQHRKVFARVSRQDFLWTAPGVALGKIPEVCAYLIVCFYCAKGAFSVGSVILYVGYLNSLIREIIAIFRAWEELKDNEPFLKTYLEFFDIPDDMYQGSLTVEKRSDKKFDIEFKNVSFRYAGMNEDAVKKINLKLKVGERLAVVGMNGSGKTTFIKLLCRLYDPSEGEIIMNDFNVRKYDYREYLNLFSVVFQDYRLLSLPLGNNVATSDTWDGEKAEKLLREAGFGERYDQMPKGLDTPLYKEFDEDGVNISGGEAQKIALARALYRDAPFIILDEPTAALDPIAEAEIYANFDRIVGDKTAIYISHRLSSCRFCDKIAVFDKGEIVQLGTHEELLSDAGGKYYELWNAQAKYYRKE